MNRREMLRWGAVGAAGAMISSAASPVGLPRIVYAPKPAPILPRQPVLTAPAGVNPQLFSKAKAALDMHGRYLSSRDVMGIVDFSAQSGEQRFHVVDLRNGRVESHLVSHGRGSDPRHSGYLDHFSNQPGSLASSKGAYLTSTNYHGKYGLSMRLKGLDWSNNNAEARAIVLHSAWYAEPEVVHQHGKLGRSEGCFAFSLASKQRVMHQLPPGHLIFADKVA